MDQNTAIFLSVGVIACVSFIYVFSQELFKYKLKKEQIKADAMVKVEEARARNQAEIDKLLYNDQKLENSKKSNKYNIFTDDEEMMERKIREKI